MIYKSLKFFNKSPLLSLKKKKKNWLTLKDKFIHLSSHMDARQCTHTQTVHLHPLCLPLLSHTFQIRWFFSFPAMAAGKVNSFLKDHLISLIVPLPLGHRILCRVETKVLQKLKCFKLQYKQGYGVPFPLAAAKIKLVAAKRKNGHKFIGLLRWCYW